MTDRQFEERLRAWYAAEVAESETAPADLGESIAAIPATAPAPLRPLGRRRNFTLLAVAAFLVVGGALAAGSGLLRFTSVAPPSPSDAAELVTPAPAPSATPRPTANLRPGSLVAFLSGGRLWIAGEDGRGAHEMFPGGVGSQGGRLAWSPDGSRMLYSDNGKLFLTDVNGSDAQLLDTGCVAPCDIDTDAAFSGDGTKIVFVRQSLDADGQVESATIATLDLASGRVALLASTASDSGRWPSWSQDGQRIVFERYGVGGVNALFVVDQDGGNLHQISPPTLAAGSSEWSPDGSRIVFWTALAPASTTVAAYPWLKDIYTIRPDGTDLRRLTDDGASSAASWSADGRILFAKKSVDDGGRRKVSFWTMDADGTNATMLVPADITGIGDDEFPTVRVARQPLGGPAIAAIAPGAPAIAVGPPPATPTPPELGPGFSWTGRSTIKDEVGKTATLLADGRVLVTAGCDTAAELYDPATGTFSPTGWMRSIQTATLLADGRVLFTGDDDCAPGGEDGKSATAELYDPTAGTFIPTGSMAAPRSGQTATMLADGRVLIAGGVTGPSRATAGGFILASYRTAAVDESVATAEIYDPTTGTFSKTDSMNTPHNGHTATLLRDGRVLVVGNGGGGNSPGKVADLYDPVTGKFTRTGSMKIGRKFHTATLLEDGRVLILGGGTANDSAAASGELYDPATGTFSPAGKMADGRASHTATRLSDGRVLIVGGWWTDGQMFTSETLSSAELYDPGTGIFSPIGSIGTPRYGHFATLLQDGRVLIAGGTDGSARRSLSVTSAVLYQP